jgi:hypothetical protein
MGEPKALSGRASGTSSSMSTPKRTSSSSVQRGVVIAPSRPASADQPVRTWVSPMKAALRP